MIKSLRCGAMAVLGLVVVVALGAQQDDPQAKAEAAARAYLREHPVANIVNADAQLRLVHLDHDRYSTQVGFRQTIGGLEVLNTEVTVRISPSGQVEPGRVDTIEKTTLPTLRPTITATEALAIASAALHAALAKTSITDLYILRKRYAGNAEDALSWYVDAIYRDSNGRGAQSLVWIDALTGKVLQIQAAPGVG